MGFPAEIVSNSLLGKRYFFEKTLHYCRDLESEFDTEYDTEPCIKNMIFLYFWCDRKTFYLIETFKGYKFLSLRLDNYDSLLLIKYCGNCQKLSGAKLTGSYLIIGSKLHTRILSVLYCCPNQLVTTANTVTNFIRNRAVR